MSKIRDLLKEQKSIMKRMDYEIYYLEKLIEEGISIYHPNYIKEKIKRYQNDINAINYNNGLLDIEFKKYIDNIIDVFINTDD